MSRYPSPRLKGYDYSQSGAYFVTICTEGRVCSLGQVVDGTARLAQPGEIARTTWTTLPDRFDGLELDTAVVMPNHLHGILLLPPAPSPPLGTVVRAFKAASSRLIRVSAHPSFAWQRNYYEHVIRSEIELDRIRQYILANPWRWQQKQSMLRLEASTRQRPAQP